jgi:digeranylgeranylglycerophospholipid reductase
MMNNFDVLIIGAGPAGSMAAYTLAKSGISCGIIEQKKVPGYPVCCGEAISEASLKAAGIYNGSYINRKISGFRVFFPNNKFFFVKSPGCVINRDKFDSYIFNLAKESGARVFLKHKALAMKRIESGFEVTTDKGTFTSKYLIGADGPRSMVDSIFFKNMTVNLDSCQYKLTKSKYKYQSSDFVDFYYDNLSNYYFWIFEKIKELNIGCCENDKEILKKFIRNHFNVPDFEYTGFCRGQIPIGGIKNKIFDNNVFLIGDAAGLTNPVSFAGIFTAILSAKVCAYSIYGAEKMGKKESPKIYERVIRKQGYAHKSLKYVSARCYKFPQEVLNFIGEYFDGRDFRTKDYMRFLKLLIKHPIILLHVLPLIKHRQLLRHNLGSLW